MDARTCIKEADRNYIGRRFTKAIRYYKLAIAKIGYKNPLDYHLRCALINCGRAYEEIGQISLANIVYSKLPKEDLKFLGIL